MPSSADMSAVPERARSEETESSEQEDATWEADEIVPGLYLGGLASALDAAALAERNIQCVVSAHEEEQRPPACLWHMMQLADRADTDILRELHGVCDLLAEQQLGAGSRAALVHCIAGMSRSCTLVAAFLVRERRMSLRDAMGLIKARRPGVAPNRGFWRQLVEFERGCREGEASYTESELPGSIMFERDSLDRIIAAHQNREKRKPAQAQPQQTPSSLRSKRLREAEHEAEAAADGQ